MIYPPLSSSVIMPVVNGIYIVCSYATQSYEAYKESKGGKRRIGQLAFDNFVNSFQANKILDRWLQDVGYKPKEDAGFDSAKIEAMEVELETCPHCGGAEVVTNGIHWWNCPRCEGCGEIEVKEEGEQ